MADRPLEELATAVKDDFALVAEDISALAKAEMSRDSTKIGVAIAAFGLAGCAATMAVVLLLITAAQALIAAGLAPWVAYLADAGIALVAVLILVITGVILLKRIKGPKRTATAIKDTLAALRGRTPQAAAAERAARAADAA